MSSSAKSTTRKETKLEKNLRLAREVKAQEEAKGINRLPIAPVLTIKSAQVLIEEEAEQERLKKEELRRAQDGKIVERLIVEGLREEMEQKEMLLRQNNFQRNCTDVVFSTHALERMAQRGISQEQVLSNSSQVTIVRKIVDGKMVIVTVYARGEKEDDDYDGV